MFGLYESKVDNNMLADPSTPDGLRYVDTEVTCVEFFYLVQPIRIHFHTRIMSTDEMNTVVVIKQFFNTSP